MGGGITATTPAPRTTSFGGGGAGGSFRPGGQSAASTFARQTSKSAYSQQQPANNQWDRNPTKVIFLNSKCMCVVARNKRLHLLHTGTYFFHLGTSLGPNIRVVASTLTQEIPATSV